MMKRSVSLISLMVCLAGSVMVGQSQAAPPGERRSKAGNPPRKVVVGTAIFGPYGKYPGLDERLRCWAV